MQSQINRVIKDPKVEELIKENIKLKEKLDFLKQNLFELKKYIENDVYVKLELKTKLLKESLEINQNLEKKIESFTIEENNIKSCENQMKLYREKVNEGVKEKIELQKLIQHQEAIIKSYEIELTSLKDLILSKDIKYKELNKAFLSLNKISDERNQFILNLQNQTIKKESEEKGYKLLLYQKEQEIMYLRNLFKTNNNQKQLSGNLKSNNRKIDLKSNQESNVFTINKYQIASNENIKKHCQLKTLDKLNKSLNAYKKIKNLVIEDEKIKELKEKLDQLLQEE